MSFFSWANFSLTLQCFGLSWVGHSPVHNRVLSLEVRVNGVRNARQAKGTYHVVLVKRSEKVHVFMVMEELNTVLL
jgi:hypothetical protein